MNRNRSNRPAATSIAVVVAVATLAVCAGMPPAAAETVLESAPVLSIERELDLRALLTEAAVLRELGEERPIDALAKHRQYGELMHSFAIHDELGVLRLIGESDFRSWSSSALIDELHQREKTIYGDDNRVDVYELELDRGRRIADGLSTSRLDRILDRTRSVALVTSKWDIAVCAHGDVPVEVTPDSDSCELDLLPYGVRKPEKLCLTEKFHGQPHGGFCTAFIVGPKLLATAGHCLTANSVTNRRFVFGFRLGADGASPSARVPTAEVYAGVRLVGRAYDSEASPFKVTSSDL